MPKKDWRPQVDPDGGIIPLAQVNSEGSASVVDVGGGIGDWRSQTEDGGIIPRAQAETIDSSDGSSLVSSTYYYTDTWRLMEAIRYNLIEYRKDNKNYVLDQVKNWRLGFVGSDSALPTITVFPVIKEFGGRQSGGFQYVRYTMAIEVYSDRRPNLADAKVFSLQAIDDIRNCIKKSVKMPGKDGYLNVIGTRIVNTQMREMPEDDNQGFQSRAAVEISCTAYHQMNTERVNESIRYDSEFEEFFDKLEHTFRTQVLKEIPAIRSFVAKVPKSVVSFPSVAMLPADEEFGEEMTNQYGSFSRPISFFVLDQQLPSEAAMKRNLEIADDIVPELERHYMLEGYSEDCFIDTVDYQVGTEAIAFASVVNARYRCKKKMEIEVLG